MAIQEDTIRGDAPADVGSQIKRKSLKPSLFRRAIYDPFVFLFDMVWRAILWVLGFILVGIVLSNYATTILNSLITKGTISADDFGSYSISPQITAHWDWVIVGTVVFAMVAFLSWRANRIRHPRGGPIPPELASYYNIAQVGKVNPSPRFISLYQPIYVARRLQGSNESADAAARQALKEARTRSGMAGGPVGICVTGRTGSGVTRLAWEAMKKELGDWTFVDWQTEPQRFGELFEALRRRGDNVVIWLGNLSKYLLTSDYPVIISLPSYLRNQGFKYVLIATCSETDPDGPIHDRFRDLLNDLTSISPADITREEARYLVGELSKSGTNVEIEEPFEGTPGSILLAINNMRDIKYGRLSPTARQILRALKLLRSAGIREYTFSRLISTLVNVFGFNENMWDEAYNELHAAGFLRSSVSTLGPTPEQRYEPVAEVYLDVAVPDYRDSNDPASHDWPALEQSFAKSKDVLGLTRLGQTCLGAGQVDQSVTCLRSALNLASGSPRSLELATINFNLGVACTVQIERSTEGPTLASLQEIENYFDYALGVFTQANDPLSWAAAQKGLADILLRKASQTTKTRERIRALDEASEAHKDAVKVLTAETTPQEWAETQFNYGLILQLQAQMETSASARRAMYDKSVGALEEAIDKLDRRKSAFTWFRAQRGLGEVCLERALTARRPNKDRLLQRAVSALRQAVSFPPPEVSQRDLGDTYMELGQSLNAVAAISDQEATAEYFKQAAEAFRNALSRYQTGQTSVGQFADERVQALRSLAQADSAYLDRVKGVGAAGMRTEAINSYEKALESFKSDSGQEIRVALAEQYFKRSMELPGPTGSMACDDVRHAQELVSHALKYAATKKDAVLSRRANKLQQDCLARAAALGCTPIQGK